MIHRIYTGSDSQASAIADLFEGDGCDVQKNKPLGRDFVMLEIRDTDEFLDASLASRRG